MPDRGGAHKCQELCRVGGARADACLLQSLHHSVTSEPLHLEGQKGSETISLYPRLTEVSTCPTTVPCGRALSFFGLQWLDLSSTGSDHMVFLTGEPEDSMSTEICRRIVVIDTTLQVKGDDDHVEVAVTLWVQARGRG